MLKEFSLFICALPRKKKITSDHPHATHYDKAYSSTHADLILVLVSMLSILGSLHPPLIYVLV